MGLLCRIMGSQIFLGYFVTHAAPASLLVSSSPFITCSYQSDLPSPSFIGYGLWLSLTVCGHRVGRLRFCSNDYLVPGSPVTRYEPTVGLSVEKTADSIKVKNAFVLSLEDQFTYGVWVKPTNNSHPQEFFLVMHIANNYALSCGNGYVQVAFRNEKPGWMWKKTSIQLAPDQYVPH